MLLVIVKLAIDKSGVRGRLPSGGGELGRLRCVCALFCFSFSLSGVRRMSSFTSWVKSNI